MVRDKNLGRAVVGGVVGTLFMGHGAQKLFGKFGGHGLEGTGQFFESGIGLRPGKAHAAIAGTSELVGGALTATGIAPPVAATMLHGVMTTAIETVHGEKGVWVTEGGYEYNLVLMAVIFGLTANRSGVPAAFGSLAAGVGGALAMLKLTRRAPDAQGGQPGGDEADTRFAPDEAAQAGAPAASATA